MYLQPLFGLAVIEELKTSLHVTSSVRSEDDIIPHSHLFPDLYNTPTPFPKLHLIIHSSYPILHTPSIPFSHSPIHSGVGLSNSIRDSMSNNTGIEANSGHALGTVFCHSASSQPNIGRWIDPTGAEIPFLGNHIFQVQFHNATFHSYTSITLKEGIWLTSNIYQEQVEYLLSTLGTICVYISYTVSP